MQNVLEDFEATISNSYERLTRMTDAESNISKEPGKWSRKEIIGHLIDSATNNHHRFVRAQFIDQLLITRYEQKEWVQSQDYRSEPWADLILLWRSYNAHLLHVASRIPEDRLDTLCRFEDGESVSLRFLVEDYVVHMKHHLKQILD